MRLIEGEGLVLRVARDEDRERWLELLLDPLEVRYGLPAFVPLPEGIGDLDSRIAENRAKAEAREPGSFVIADAGTDLMLGDIGWRQESPPLQIADIGYGVHPSARRQGVATRAVRLMTRWLTVEESGPRLPRVQLDHSTENDASCRTAVRAGLEKEGVRRCFLPLRDPDAPGGVRRHDVCMHGHVPA